MRLRRTAILKSKEQSLRLMQAIRDESAQHLTCSDNQVDACKDHVADSEGQLAGPAEYEEHIEPEKECTLETTCDEVEYLFNKVLETLQNDEVCLQALTWFQDTVLDAPFDRCKPEKYELFAADEETLSEKLLSELLDYLVPPPDHPVPYHLPDEETMECYSTMYDVFENSEPDVPQRWSMASTQARRVLWEACAALWRKTIDDRQLLETQEHELQELIRQLRDTCGQAAPELKPCIAQIKTCRDMIASLRDAYQTQVCHLLQLPEMAFQDEHRFSLWASLKLTCSDASLS